MMIKNVKKNHYKAFSLIELSIVILVIGVLIAGVTQGTALLGKMRLAAAQSLTSSSPVTSIEGLVVWYETTLEKSLIQSEASNGESVSKWYDINPRAIEKYDATSVTNPLYASGGINNIPALEFSGSEYMSISTDIVSGLSPYTVFIVEARNSTTSGPMIGTASSTNGIILGYDGDTTLKLHNSYTHHGSNNDWAPYTISGYSSVTPRILTFVGDNSGLATNRIRGYIYINNSVAVNGGQRYAQGPNSTYWIARTNNSNFTNKYYKGFIGEIIVFDRKLKDDERDDIASYLSQKWKIKI